jgi:hypothetical protein
MKVGSMACLYLHQTVVRVTNGAWFRHVEAQDPTIKLKKKKTKLRGLSPRANYTDRATAACQRN